MFCLSNICYLCLAFHKNIVSQNNETLKWRKKLQYFIPDHILQESDVPKYICDHCIKNIEKMYEFRVKCLGNIKIFNKHIQKLTQVPSSYQCLSVMLTEILPNKRLEVLSDIYNDIGSLNEEVIHDFEAGSNLLGADDFILSSDNQFKKVFKGFEDLKNTLIKCDNKMVQISSKEETKDILIMTEAGNISKSSTEKILTNNNMEQVSIQYEKTWMNIGIIEPLVTKNYGSTSKERNYNISKYEAYKTNNYTLPKNEDLKSKNIENCDHVPSKYEDRQETISAKKEITEAQENPESEKFSSSNLYCVNEDESRVGPCAINEDVTEMNENIEKIDIFKVDGKLEDICLKKEITEELIIKDEPDFIGIETQGNTDPEQSLDGNFSTEDESVAGPNKNSICEFQRKLVHTSTKPYKCDICKKKFRQESILKQHERIHTDENFYSCDVCEKTFSDKSSLVEHKIIYTNKRPYECNICKKKFHRIDAFQRHEHSHTGKYPYACDVCGKNFILKGSLVNHKIIHTGERPYACNICRRTFSRKGDFKKHGLIHTGKKSYACDVCEKTLSDKSALIRHKIIHTGKRPHTCNICKKNFKLKSNLKTHKLRHTGEKSYACNACEKTFYDKSALGRHTFIHTGERPYACDICKKSFHRIVDLKYHERKHTGDELYACDACEKSFSDKSALVRHKIIHTGKRPYACNICKKTFVRRDIFQSHKSIHTGEKPYACDVCKKTFRRKNNLAMHKIIHTRERPHACDICKKKFSGKCDLNRHKRIHTVE